MRSQTLMEAEKLMEFFDLRWFESDIFDARKVKWPNSADSVPDSSALLSRDPEVVVQIMSDRLASQGSFSTPSSVSPDSVLVTWMGSRKLSCVTMGNEPSVKEEEGVAVGKKERGLVRRKGAMSKSLSELEFEEVKGFMDLGFVFSEEDKDSRLAEIIPGLHRLGKRDTLEEGEVERQLKSEAVPRPYLSEAWEWWDTRRKDEERRQALMQWEVPVSGDESDVKCSLRLWAHNIASVVR